jgi:hypothetical protein
MATCNSTFCLVSYDATETLMWMFISFQLILVGLDAIWYIRMMMLLVSSRTAVRMRILIYICFSAFLGMHGGAFLEGMETEWVWAFGLPFQLVVVSMSAAWYCHACNLIYMM